MFKHYDTPTLDIIKNVLTEALSKPEVKGQIQKFLLEQKFPVKQDFSTEDVLQYLISRK
jgi:hypothetical protein